MIYMKTACKTLKVLYKVCSPPHLNDSFRSVVAILYIEFNFQGIEKELSYRSDLTPSLRASHRFRAHGGQGPHCRVLPTQ